MGFNQIPGHSALKKSLISSFESNHIAHAQMFTGLEGSGCLPMALAYATYLLCENKGEDDSCGHCPSCHKMKKMVHPDVHFFYPRPAIKKDKQFEDHLIRWRKFVTEQPFGSNADWIHFFGSDDKINQIGREDAREIVKRVSMKSFEGSFKIICIWYPELMHISASNAILKVLEEPPENTIYLLITNNYENVLTTIVSRTQLISIPAFEDKEVTQYLEEYHSTDKMDAERVASVAEGNIRKAISLVDQSTQLEYETFQNWMRMCWSRKYDELVFMSDNFNQLDKNSQRGQLIYALTLIRGALRALGNSALSKSGQEEAKFLNDFGKALEVDGLAEIYDSMNTAIYHLNRNANARILHLNLSIHIADKIAYFRGNK